MKKYKYALIIISFILFASCSSNNKSVRIEEPLSHKEFQIRKGTLEKKEFSIKNVFYYKFSTNIQFVVGTQNCYILLVSDNPTSCIIRDREKDLMEKVIPPQYVIACYIPINNIKIVEKLLNMKCEDKIDEIVGIGEYPFYLGGRGFFNILSIKIPYTTVGVLVKSITVKSDN